MSLQNYFEEQKKLERAFSYMMNTLTIYEDFLVYISKNLIDSSALSTFRFTSGDLTAYYDTAYSCVLIKYKDMQLPANLNDAGKKVPGLKERYYATLDDVLAAFRSLPDIQDQVFKMLKLDLNFCAEEVLKVLEPVIVETAL